MDLHNPVFIISSILVLLFVIGTLIFPSEAKEAFDGSKGWSIEHYPGPSRARSRVAPVARSLLV